MKVLFVLLMWLYFPHTQSIPIVISTYGKSHTSVFSWTHVRIDVYSAETKPIAVLVDLPPTITIVFGVIDNKSGQSNPPCELQQHSAVCTVYAQASKIGQIFLTLLPQCAIPEKQTIDVQAIDNDLRIQFVTSHELTVSSKYQQFLQLIGG